MELLRASAACLVVLAGPALAADYLDPLPRYERFDKDFKCHLSREDSAKMKALDWPADQACMRIGPLYMGMSRDALEKLLGAPDQSVKLNGKIYFLYPVLRDEAKNAVIVYTAISYAEGNFATSLQLSAIADPPSPTQWLKPWWFSGVALGDSQDMLRDRMGEPFKTEKTDQADTVMWNYQYFSFEIRDGHVTSIRTARESESNRKKA